MLDWSALRHADGNAADVPQLLSEMTPDTQANVWGELWGLLCHQGTVYSASFAALPSLLAAAERWKPRDRAQVIALAASILASDDVYDGRRDDFVRPVEWVRQRFQEACREALAETGLPRHDFIYLLQSSRSFDGDQFWGQELDHLASGEFPGLCPHCRVDLYIVIGEYGIFTTAEEWVARSGKPGTVRVRPGVKCTAIQPDEGALPEIGQWLLDCAHAARQVDVAEWIRYVFGSSECPACNRRFQVIDAIRAP